MGLLCSAIELEVWKYCGNVFKDDLSENLQDRNPRVLLGSFWDLLRKFCFKTEVISIEFQSNSYRLKELEWVFHKIKKYFPQTFFSFNVSVRAFLDQKQHLAEISKFCWIQLHF